MWSYIFQDPALFHIIVINHYSHCTKNDIHKSHYFAQIKCREFCSIWQKNYYIMTNFSFSIISTGMKKSSGNTTCPTNQWECSPIWLAEKFLIWKRLIGWLARIEVSEILKKCKIMLDFTHECYRFQSTYNPQ